MPEVTRMKLRSVLEEIDRAAPFALAADWDNVGLMVGDPDREVRRLGIALDPLPEAVAEAADRGCEALLTHHPLFFSPIRRLDLSRDPGRAVLAAVERGVAVLAAHTNWDSAEGGVSFELARLLGLRDVSVLDPDARLGAVGNFEEPLTAGEGLERVRRAWGLSWLDGYVSESCSILRVALCGGGPASAGAPGRSLPRTSPTMRTASSRSIGSGILLVGTPEIVALRLRRG